MSDQRVAELDVMRGFIADKITEQADDTDFDTATDLVDELTRLKKTADEAIRMLNDERMRQLEKTGAKQHGRRVFARVKDYNERFDHELIVNAAIEQGIAAAVDPDSGEINPRIAAEAAARTINKVYVSAATKAKVTVLDALGLDRKEYKSREFKQWKLSVTEIEAGDDDE